MRYYKCMVLIPHGHALIWYYTMTIWNYTNYDDMYAQIAEIMKSET